ncbi:prepilin peptidase [bacterium]|nr:prepilin peptidase [bacterium]
MADLTPFLIATGAVLGLVFGSFLNVVAYRLPLGKSVSHPPSACPTCGHAIRARDNIPVLSWLILRGMCRDCATPISPRYAIVEVGTAGLFALTAWLIGEAWVLPAYWWFAAVGIVLTLTDLDHKRIPNRILIPGTIVGAVLLSVGAVLDGDPAALLRALGGGAAYFAGFLLLAIAARGGFGFGDVKLAFLLGGFLTYQSWRVLGVGVFAAFVVGGLVSVGLLIARKAGRRDAIAFGPAMVAGAWISVTWGEAIASWYLG